MYHRKTGEGKDESITLNCETNACKHNFITDLQSLNMALFICIVLLCACTVDYACEREREAADSIVALNARV